jgi:Protein of unknown function (DUF3995)
MGNGARLLALGSSAVLASVSALHVAWGFGSSWPFPDRDALAHEVAGTAEMPSPASCFVVGTALAGAAAVAAGVGGDQRLARLARASVAAALIIRGLTGLTGTTGRLVSWTPSGHFTEIDRRRYGPFCLGTGAAVAASMIRSRAVRTCR